MTRKSFSATIIIIVSLIWLLTGCGSGNGSLSSNTSPAPTQNPDQGIPGNGGQNIPQKWILDSQATVYSLDHDNAGNIYIFGYSYNVSNGYFLFLSKFNSLGEEQWSQNLGGIFYFGGNMSVKGSKIYTAFTQTDSRPTITALDTQTGQKLWQQSGPSGEIKAVADDSYVYGIVSDCSYVYLAKLNAIDGSTALVNTMITNISGSNSCGEIQDVAIDSNSNIYVTGYTNSNTATTLIGAIDVITGAFDSNGNQIWLKQYGTINWDSGNGIIADMSGIYASACVDNNWAILKAGHQLVVKYDPLTGTQLWSQENSSLLTSDFRNKEAITSDNNSIYVATDKILQKIDKNNQSVLWEKNGTSRFTALLLYNNVLYAVNENSNAINRYNPTDGSLL